MPGFRIRENEKRNVCVVVVEKFFVLLLFTTYNMRLQLLSTALFGALPLLKDPLPPARSETTNSPNNRVTRI